MPDGPTFSCPECGKQYPWKAELAGKKGRCKCGAIMHVPASSSGVAAKAASKGGSGSGSKSGTQSGSKSGSKGGSSVMPGSSHFATRPRPTPQPIAVGDDGDSYNGNGETAEQDVVVAPPAYSPTAAPTSSARATGTKFTPAAPEAAGKPELKWAPAIRWYGLGAVVAAWAIYEFSSPLDPNVEGRILKIRLPIMLINMVLGPMGGGIVLGLGAAALFVVGTLILLGKAKDSDYEHEQAQGAWPASRGRK